MTGIDTNVLVRYLAQDDARQSALATRFIEGRLSASSAGFVPLVTLCETVWVLVDLYGADRQRVREVIERLLATRQLVLEQAETAAFDRAAARLPGFELLA